MQFVLSSLERLNGFNTLLFNICGEGGASFIYILVNNSTEYENRIVFYDLEVTEKRTYFILRLERAAAGSFSYR